jgi:ferritin-like metal-binding protein YciE
MQGLIEESKELLTAQGNEAVIDCGIIAAVQKIEHYEIAAYGTARVLAEELGLEEAANILNEILEEEKGADRKLSEITLNEIMGNLG